MTTFSEGLKAVFLDELRETANVTLAARAAGVSSGTAYKHKREDVLFAERWDEALGEAVDMLEHEAHRRAFKGTDEPVFYRGDEVGYVTKYSDSLTMFLLKAHRPDKYRERSEVKNELSGGVALNDTTRAARLAAFIQLAQRRAAQAEVADDTSDLA
jgi:hypothetical protein